MAPLTSVLGGLLTCEAVIAPETSVLVGKFVCEAVIAPEISAAGTPLAGRPVSKLPLPLKKEAVIVEAEILLVTFRLPVIT